MKQRIIFGKQWDSNKELSNNWDLIGKTGLKLFGIFNGTIPHKK